MSQRNSLLNLIQSLSPSEKRYFKVHASVHTIKNKNNYVLLFELLEKQKVYDEAEILSHFPKGFKTQLPVVKNYLYTLILKSLRNYNSGNCSDFSIKELLMNAELLTRKGLNQQASKMVAKAEKVALAHEKFENLAEIYFAKLTLVLKQDMTNPEKMRKEVTEIMDLASLNFEKFKEILRLKKLSSEMLLISRQEQFVRNDILEEAGLKIVSPEQEKEQSEHLPIRHQQFLYESRLMFCYSKWDLEGAQRNAKKIVGLMEKNRFLVEERPENYIYSLHKLIAVSLSELSLEEGLLLIKKLREADKKFPKARFSKEVLIKAATLSYNLQFNFCEARGEYQKGLALVPEFIKWTQRHNPKFKLGEGFILSDAWYKIAQLYFGSENYKEALTFINRILNNPNVSRQLNLYQHARVLQLILFFELEEWDILQSVATSLYRHLQGKPHDQVYEQVLMEVLRRFSRFQGKVQAYEFFESCLKEYAATGESTLVVNLQENFDLISWMRSKVNRRPFAEVVRSKRPKVGS